MGEVARACGLFAGMAVVALSPTIMHGQDREMTRQKANTIMTDLTSMTCSQPAEPACQVLFFFFFFFPFLRSRALGLWVWRRQDGTERRVGGPASLALRLPYVRTYIHVCKDLVNPQKSFVRRGRHAGHRCM